MKHGFTLLEILIVLVIIGLFLGFAIPSIRSMQERSQLQTAAKELRAQLGKVRLRAIETGQVFEVRYAPGTNQFQILSKPTVPRSIGDSDSNTLSSSGTTSGSSSSNSTSVTGGRLGGGSSATSSLSSSSSSSSGSSSNSTLSGSGSTNSSVSTADSGGVSGGSVSSGTGGGTSSSTGGTTSEGVSYRSIDLVEGRGLTLNSSGEIDPEVVYLGASSVWFDDPTYRSELTEDETTTGVSGSGPTELKVSALSSSSDGSSRTTSSSTSTSSSGGSNASISKVESGGVNTGESEKEIPLSEQLRRAKSDWPEPLGGTYSTTNTTGGGETTSDAGSGFTDWSSPILFFPNGRTTSATIRLWTRNNGYMDVSLRGATGQVTLSKPSRYNADLEALRRDERNYLTELRNSSSDTSTTTNTTNTTTTNTSGTSSSGTTQTSGTTSTGNTTQTTDSATSSL